MLDHSGNAAAADSTALTASAGEAAAAFQQGFVGVGTYHVERVGGAFFLAVDKEGDCDDVTGHGRFGYIILWRIGIDRMRLETVVL